MCWTVSVLGLVYPEVHKTPKPPGLNFTGWQVEIPKHQQLYNLLCNPARILVMLSGTLEGGVPAAQIQPEHLTSNNL